MTTNLIYKYKEKESLGFFLCFSSLFYVDAQEFDLMVLGNKRFIELHVVPAIMKETHSGNRYDKYNIAP